MHECYVYNFCIVVINVIMISILVYKYLARKSFVY